MKVLMAAGGTGGHVFPALALAQAFKEKFTDVEVRFVGTPSGFENTLVPSAGYTLHCLQVEGVKGKGVAQKIKSMALLPKAFFQANALLSLYRPDIVLGIGGYVSGPVMMLSSLRGILTGVLEPNAVAGFSNRTLGRWVNRVFVAFEEAKDWFPTQKTKVTGNPIRKSILEIAPPSFKAKMKTILIFGGSQGANKINKAVCDMLPMLVEQKESIHFIHQTGKNDVDFVKAAYQKLGFNADVSEFISDMDAAYREAHVVIARSGSSVLEIAACGRPSILIPYPFAADDHQAANAKVLEDAGAAVVITNAQCDGPRLYAELVKILPQDRLESMSKRALTLRKETAAEDIVETMFMSMKGAKK